MKKCLNLKDTKTVSEGDSERAVVRGKLAKNKLSLFIGFFGGNAGGLFGADRAV